MNKISLFFQLFQKGREIANPAAWKNGQIAINGITPVLYLLVEIARAYGWNVPLTEVQLSSVAAVILAVGNCVLTIITSKKVGTGSLDNSGELPSISNSGNSEEPTRAAVGYERLGPSANDRAGG